MRSAKLIKQVSQLSLHSYKTCMSISTSSSKNTKRFVALWGNGDFGRLGLSGLNSKWTPTVCTAFDGLNDTVSGISCGGAHTLFLTEKGRVYATGLNENGQLGVKEVKRFAPEPLEVSGFTKKVIHISAGYHHSSAITADGELYMWGSNKCGQLGLGKSAAKVVPVPTKVDFLSGIRIKMVTLGSEHSIAITDEGGTLSWGAGGSGRLGHGQQSSYFGFLGSASEFMPRFVKQLEGVKINSISAGLLHSACTDENGSVFEFGEKSGFAIRNHKTLPSTVSDLPGCDEIACGGYHTCAISGERDLYVWGSNENGCLGLGGIEAIRTPERVEGPFLKYSVHKISCGWKHTAAICGNNIYTWGWGGSNGSFSEGFSSGGQLGHANEFDYRHPVMVKFDKDVKALEVSCGFNHTGALLEYS